MKKCIKFSPFLTQTELWALLLKWVPHALLLTVQTQWYCYRELLYLSFEQGGTLKKYLHAYISRYTLLNQYRTWRGVDMQYRIVFQCMSPDPHKNNGSPISQCCGSRREKCPTKKRINKFHFFKGWMYSSDGWRLFLYGSLDVLVIKTLDPKPDPVSLEMLDPDPYPDSMIRIHNTAVSNA